MSKVKPAKGVQWDLTEFYSGMDDPQIEKDIKKVGRLIKAFNTKYKGKVRLPSLTPKKLLKVIEDYTVISELANKYGTYAGQLYSKNNLDEEVGAFQQNIVEVGTKYSTDLLWLGLERKEWSEKKAQEMIKSPILSGYKHFHKHERIFVPFVLSEKEEQLLNRISPVGSSALVRLYDQLGSAATYEVEVDGEIKELSHSELPPFLSYHKDRAIREKTAKSLSKGLKKQTMSYGFILNTLLLSSKIGDEIRGYKYPQEATFLSYEVKPKTVSKMISTVTDSYNICKEFYKVKAKALNLKSLHEWDRYSPIFPKEKRIYTWLEAKNIVLEAFIDFDEEFGLIAEKFFDEGWIDAEITPGKSAGAYCNYGVPSTHPFILMNFNGELGDISTLAHELGHGIHSYLSRDQTLYEFYPSTASAEIASVFAESLVFDRLYSGLESKEEKANLLANKLQDSFATVFRQTAFYLFEEDINKHRREKGELKVSEFNDYYQKRIQAMFGTGLKLTNNHKYWWMPISHFYHYDFYVFTYAFGELLTNALYAQYKEKGKEFTSNYLKALSMGGSKDPYELTKIMGVDINTKDFWKRGLDSLDVYVKEFKKLVD